MAAELEVDDRLGLFAEALRAQLERSLKIKFLPGYLPGPNRSVEDLGSVYVRTENEVANRVLELELHAVVRIVPQFNDEAAQDAETPYDPAPLYKWAAALKAAVCAHQTDLGPWFQRVTQVDLDVNLQALTAQVLAYDTNPGV